MLTKEQKAKKAAIVRAAARVAAADGTYRRLMAACTSHVLIEKNESAVCAICRTHCGWYCPSKLTHLCMYTESEDWCDHCHSPEERK